jgi:coproporphyrinogen III oxidase
MLAIENMKIDAHGLKLQNIDSMLMKFDEAKKWLEVQNLRVDRTRFNQYRKITDDYFLKRNGVRFTETGILWAFTELHEILEIYKFLKDVEESKVKESLKKVVPRCFMWVTP